MRCANVLPAWIVARAASAGNARSMISINGVSPGSPAIPDTLACYSNRRLMQTRGYAATAADTPLAPFAFDRRSPGDRDVHVNIEFCGICHSDIHFTKNEWGMTTYPAVPGHEIIGRVVKVGKNVKNFQEGQRVGVGCFVNSCGKCGSCRGGHENYCEIGPIMTYASLEPDGVTPTFGGYSRDIVVDEHFVLNIPEGLDPAGAAPLLCAGITTYAPSASRRARGWR